MNAEAFALTTGTPYMYKSYKDDCRALSASHAELSATFEKWSFLHDLLQWANAPGAEIGDIDFIQQDEFSHDVIVHHRSINQFIVFGVT
jgi:hypothetical protein